MINDHITAILTHCPSIMLSMTAHRSQVEWLAIETQAIKDSAGIKTSNYEQRLAKGQTIEDAIASCMLAAFKPCQEVDFQN